MVQGTSIKGLTKEDLLKKKVIITNYVNEQRKIGQFFKHLDDMIALHQKKIEKTKALKSAYFAEMFPAEGERVPKRRFAGFTSKWEQIKFEDLLTVHASKSFISNINEPGKYEVVQQGDKPITGFANGEPFQDYKNVILFGDHTLSLYKPRNPFFVATDGLKILSADKLTSKFLYVLLNKYKPESQGYKRHFTILQNEECFIPNNQEEQQMIGSFFEKLDKLKAIKQAYLNEMFV